MKLKEFVRSILIFFHFDITKNLEYDRCTQAIMKSVIKENDNCIDIGCHKGEILNMMLRFSPKGKHYAFEPIPYLFEELERKFGEKAVVFPFALSERSGTSTFQLVKNAPAYSGINRRRYDIAKPEIEEIYVGLRTLDEMIPSEQPVHFIKIDVEGGEFGVLKGAKNLLKRNKPIIIFEYGKGASDYYGTHPLDIYNFITQEIGLDIYTLKSFLKKGQFMEAAEFEKCYNSNEEYYFLASKSR